MPEARFDSADSTIKRKNEKTKKREMIMITDRPSVSPTGLYTQTQAAQALQVSRHTVKRYADDGFLMFRVRKANGRKVVTGKEILKCWEGRYL